MSKKDKKNILPESLKGVSSDINVNYIKVTKEMVGELKEMPVKAFAPVQDHVPPEPDFRK